MHPDHRLLRAAAEGNVLGVRLALRGGADVLACDLHWMTALHFAAQGGHRAVVNMLLNAGADVNFATRHGETPLTCTMDFLQSSKTVRENLLRARRIVFDLLEVGADPYYACDFDETPVAYACNLDEPAVLRRMLQSTEVPDGATLLGGQPAAYGLAAEAIKGGSVACLEVLAEFGAFEGMGEIERRALHRTLDNADLPEAGADGWTLPEVLTRLCPVRMVSTPERTLTSAISGIALPPASPTLPAPPADISPPDAKRRRLEPS